MNIREGRANRLVVAVAVVFVITSQAASQSNKSDRELEGLIGPVKSVTTETEEPGKARVKGEQVSFDKAGNKTEVLKFSADGSVQSKTVYSYDAKGNLVGVTSYGPNGAPSSKISHSYGANGRRTETVSLDGEGRTTNKTSYTYDAAGRLAEGPEYLGIR